jgi:hypothetical protein
MKLSIVAFSRLIIKKHGLVRHSRHQWMKGNIILYRNPNGCQLSRPFGDDCLITTVRKDEGNVTTGYSYYDCSYFGWHEQFIEDVVRPTLFRRALDEMINQ